MKKSNAGFTMIELMIVVAIIGILARIAYPSYVKQVVKSNRSDAKIKIADVSQRMQRCFTAQSTFNPTTGLCAVKDAATAASGIASDNGYYTISIAAADLTATTFKIKATAVSGKRQANDNDCSLFQIDQTGKKLAQNAGGDDTTSTCW